VAFRIAIVLAALLAPALGSTRAAGASAATPPAAEGTATGRALAVAGQCGRCHEVAGLGLPATARERSCSGCHRWIRAAALDPFESAHARQVYPRWDSYLENVASFLEVPDLLASAARLRPELVATYLRAPYKVRPGMPETMIRTRLEPAEAEALAGWLAAEAASRRPGSPAARAAAAIPLSHAAADVDAGRALHAKLGCATCHAAPAPSTGRAAIPAAAAAPDLRHVAARMTPENLASFIADPAAFGGETRMPAYNLTPRDAARLRDYLWTEATRARTRSTLTTGNAAAAFDAGAEGDAGSALDRRPLPPRRGRALYAEVRARVLDAVCIHCHMDPRRNDGDGGPGNTGGLGYPGVGLDLESWSGIKRGARDAAGRRASVLDPPPGGGPPRLLARLQARHAEHAAELAGPAAVRSAGGAPGMPLGLPPVSATNLALIRTWLAAGAPGPDGKPARRRR
jgi:hypothetical protein